MPPTPPPLFLYNWVLGLIGKEKIDKEIENLSVDLMHFLHTHF